MKAIPTVGKPLSKGGGFFVFAAKQLSDIIIYATNAGMRVKILYLFMWVSNHFVFD
jgi:hypothetical protein